MENFGLKGLGATLWQRVVLSYKTTLIALLIIAADAAVSYLNTVQLPTWAHSLVGVAASILLLVKERNTKVLPAPTPPAGFAGLRLLVVLAAVLSVLSLSGCAFFRPVQPKLVACAMNPAISLAPKVAAALASGPEWQGKLEALAVAAGVEVVVCAIQVVIDGLENTHPNGGAGEECLAAPCPVAPEVQLVRAYHFLQVQGLQPSH